MTDEREAVDAPLTDETLDSLERYAVEGPAALGDPAVAMALADRAGLTARIGQLLDRWRAVPPARTEASLARTLDRLQLAPSRFTPMITSRRPRAPRWLGGVAGRGGFSWRMMVLPAALTGIAIGFVLGSRTTSSPSESVVKTYATTGGQRAVVTLPDGTRMSLAPATRVELVDGFGTSSRTVVVHGAALFDVSHATGAPFIVRAGRSATRVLGTRFSVRRYADESVARITVAQGKVSVRTTLPRGDSDVSAADEAIVTAGAMALCADSGAITLLPRVAIDDDLAPYDGRLVFRGAPLREIAAELSRTYGVTVMVADSTLAARRVTFSTAVDAQSLDGILSALVAAVPPAHIERRQGTVIIVAGRKASASPSTPRTMRPETSYGR